MLEFPNNQFSGTEMFLVQETVLRTSHLFQKNAFLKSETMWIGLFIVLCEKVRVVELQLCLLNCSRMPKHMFQCVRTSTIV